MNTLALDKTYLDRIRRWMEQQADSRSIKARILMDAARPEGKWLHIPVSLPADMDVYEKAVALTELENTWNDQDPKPEWRVVLDPGPGV